MAIGWPYLREDWTYVDPSAPNCASDSVMSLTLQRQPHRQGRRPAYKENIVVNDQQETRRAESQTCYQERDAE